jgi:hypothetical protein
MLYVRHGMKNLQLRRHEGKNRTLIGLMRLIATDKKHPPTPLKGGLKISANQFNQCHQCSILRDFVTSWQNSGDT